MNFLGWWTYGLINKNNYTNLLLTGYECKPVKSPENWQRVSFQIKDIDYFVIASLDTNLIDIVSIGVGGILILVSFFGCFGVCRHSANVLKTYGGILAVLILAEVGIGVLGYIYK